MRHSRRQRTKRSKEGAGPFQTTACAIRHTRYSLGLACGLVALFCGLGSRAAEVDLSKLPPPATNQVDFLRDIKPIFDTHCLKCHGPERPKSQFRVDSRAAVLKGGENGVDVVPGHSANSALIHYVAGLVEDMEMPPKGKGKPLTSTEVSLLRAWIDQGVTWAGVDQTVQEEYTIASFVGWTGVHGDQSKFREHYWQPEGWNAGLQNYQFKEQLDWQRHLTVAARALRDDYKVALALNQTDFGFTRFGWEQYRKYYDDSGGYYRPFNPPITRLDRDLHLDIGRAWAEVGLTLPSWPQIVFGYEYQYQDGTKSLLQWLPVRPGTETKGIGPVSQSLNERVHVIRLDLHHDVAGLRAEDNFHYEFADLDSSRFSVGYDQLFAEPRLFIEEGHDYQQWANAFRLEKQLKDWWLVSGGYLYTRFDGDSSFDQKTIDATGALVDGSFWRAPAIMLEQSSHTINLNSQLGPWQGLSVAAGLQTEWSRQQGFGNVGLSEGFDADGDPTTLTTNTPAVVSANLDRFNAQETFTLRYTRIPCTVLSADGRFQQETIGQFEEQIDGNHYAFLRDTDAENDWRELRAGFNVSPWRQLSFSAHYRRVDHESDFHHHPDRLFDFLGQPIRGDGYSAFITGRETHSDQVESKLVWRPRPWLKTTLSYKLVSTDFETVTDSVPGPLPVLPTISPGGRILAGEYDAHRYSLNATFTPLQRLHLSTTFTLEDSRTRSFQNGDPTVEPYRGHIYSVLARGTYVLNEKTDLNASYAFSYADYEQSNEASGLPLGIIYHRHAVQAGITRRIRQRFAVGLQYGYFYYDEPTSGHFTDYTAHALFATLAVKAP